MSGRHLSILIFWEDDIQKTLITLFKNILNSQSFIKLYNLFLGASLIAQLGKNLPAVQETWVWFLGWEDLLEKEMVTHSSILANPWTIAHQAPLSMRFSRQEYWSGVPLPSVPSEGRQTENHNYRKLANLITWVTALSNSMKLWAMPCRTTQDR